MSDLRQDGMVPRDAANVRGWSILKWRFDMPRVPHRSKAINQTELSLDVGPAWVVYVLCDPRVDDPIQRIRYVGVTHGTANARLSGHLREARRGGQNHRCNWIRSLLAEDVSPVMEVIDPGVVERAWDRSEIAWIAHYRAMGCPITNGTDGGEGASKGRKYSVESIERMRASQQKRWARSEEHDRASIAQQRRFAVHEQRANLAAIHRQYVEDLKNKRCRDRAKMSDETKAKISAAAKKRRVSAEEKS